MQIAEPEGPLLGLRARPLVHRDRLDDLVALRGLVEAGRVTPVLDRTHPLTEVARAVEDVRRGRVRGRAVVTPWSGGCAVRGHSPRVVTGEPSWIALPSRTGSATRSPTWPGRRHRRCGRSCRPPPTR
ncbi:zinc-binding dehydrogenase [Saccharothrix sp. Mg75]|uniref:zinc-binding dehydrogenase n=1 Tax=Saccharothrix sp. Mg75 TaxID=3445357 RepID=UPI003EE86779